MMPKLALCLFAMASLAATARAQLKPTPLTGTWRVTEAKTTGPNARTVSSPQPGLLIFTGNHFSRMIITSDQPRTALTDQPKATAAELLATWGPFNAASGTYEVSGDNLTVHPVVAKNPQVMAPGAVLVYSFKLEGNTLTTTDVRNANGPVANPATITYTRIE
jgi:predicted acyl esterase